MASVSDSRPLTIILDLFASEKVGAILSPAVDLSDLPFDNVQFATTFLSLHLSTLVHRLPAKEQKSLLNNLFKNFDRLSDHLPFAYDKLNKEIGKSFGKFKYTSKWCVSSSPHISKALQDPTVVIYELGEQPVPPKIVQYHGDTGPRITDWRDSIDKLDDCDEARTDLGVPRAGEHVQHDAAKWELEATAAEETAEMKKWDNWMSETFEP